MKIGKTFHFIASIVSCVAFLTMLAPIANIQSVNMIQSALGINCTATWSNTVIFFVQLIQMALSIFVFISVGKKYNNYKKIKYLRIPQISLAFIQILFAFLTTQIIGVPSGYGISLGAGPIMYAVTYLLFEVFIVLSFIFVAKKDNNVSIEVNNKHVNNNSTNNIDLLIKYKELLDKQIITKKEFEDKKKELLNK